MTTPVTLSASVTELTIGTTTSLTYGGGDGTGGYRFNNSTSSFCSVNSSGVVSANYPGQCTFSVTRLASGKYIDTTSPTVSIMALPEPDKSVISTPEPDPTPTPRASRSATPTPTANPVSAPAPVVIRENSDTPVTKIVTTPLMKKITGLKATLSQTIQSNGYKFTWSADKQAVSYAVTISTGNVKTNYESKVPNIDVKMLSPGNYTIEITAIDSKGKISSPTLNKFTVPSPTDVKLTAMLPLKNPVIDATTSKELGKFLSQSTSGFPIEIVIEYPKDVKGSVTQAKKATDLVTKYVKDKRPGIQAGISIKALVGSWNFVTIRGVAKKQRATLLISRG